MQIIKNKPNVQNKINYFQDSPLDGKKGLPSSLILEILSHLLKPEDNSTRKWMASVRDVMAFGSTCKRLHNNVFNSKIWELAFNLISRFNCSPNSELSYYDSFKKNMIPAFNIYKGKESLYLMKSDCCLIGSNKNIIICSGEKQYSMNKTCYQIKNELIEKIHFKRFIIDETQTDGCYSNIKIIDLNCNENKLNEIKSIRKIKDFQLNNTEIYFVSIDPSNDFLCLGKKFLLTLDEDDENKSQINMKIFDMQTAKEFKTKKNIINTFDQQKFYISCSKEEKIVCFLKHNEYQTYVEILIYDLENDSEYKCNANKTISSEIYADSNYMAYYGDDGVITFIDRKNKNKKWIDLGNEIENKKSWEEINQTGIMNDVFVHIDSKNKKQIRLWDLRFGTGEISPSYEMVISQNSDTKIYYTMCQNQICIWNEESEETFYNLQLEEKLQQEDNRISFRINDHLRFINIPATGCITIDQPNEEIKIYNTSLGEIITLNPYPPLIDDLFPYFGPMALSVNVNSLWGNFLAFSGLTEGELSIFIFDLDTGELLKTISLSAFFKTKGWDDLHVDITKIKWCGNGLLRIMFDLSLYSEDDDQNNVWRLPPNNEDLILFINFHDEFPFDTDVIDDDLVDNDAVNDDLVDNNAVNDDMVDEESSSDLPSA